MFTEIHGERVFVAGGISNPEDLTLLFLHGAAMDHTVWTYYIRYFRYRGVNAIALDFPGHGRSEGDTLKSIDQMAEWVAATCDELKLSRIALVGHSMGGLVALESGARLTSRVERIALLGVAFPMAVSDVLLDAAKANLSSAVDMMTVWGHGTKAQLGGNPVAGINVIGSARRLIERASPGVMFDDLNACNEYTGGFDAAAKTGATTIFICGSDDKMTPARAAVKLADKCADGRVEVISDCGHILMSEQPELTHRALVKALL